jgi:Na+/H+ antiporter NhaC
MDKKPNARALLPILVFLILYLGSGIYFEYIHPQKGGMGFYVMSVVVAFVIALIVALLQNRKLNFDQKIHICAKGIGDDNITIMLFIFLVAGAFSGIASKAGGAVSTANLLLNIIPAKFAIPGMFIIACLISMAMGTSVGTVTVLVPIAAKIAAQTGLGLALCVGTVVGGAMFGDNLSFVSDTTIAATKTQGVEMKDKFRVNFRIALPSAIATLVILTVMSMNSDIADIGPFKYNIWQALPYFIVLVGALLGFNVFAVLCSGCVMFAIVGLGTGTLNMSTVFSSMGDGTSGMFETIVVTILVASIGALMKEYGGFAAILSFIRKRSNSRRGGMAGIGLLTLLMDISTANNTVAIVLSAPIAKDISEEYGIDPRKTASLLDTFSCIGQGIIPYGAQILIAASLASEAADTALSTVSIIPYLFYQFILLIAVFIWIALDRPVDRKAAQ